MKKSDHLKLRCDDGNRQRPAFDDRAGGRARKRMMPGSRGKWTDGWGDGIRSHRGKEVDADPTLEREESEILVAQGLNYAKIGPFLSTDRSFFENLCSGVANTCSHRSCKLQSEEHFIVWLHWFVPSARSKKGLKHGHVSHSHISRVYIGVTTEWRTFGTTTTTECMQGSRRTSVAHWIG